MPHRAEPHSDQSGEVARLKRLLDQRGKDAADAEDALSAMKADADRTRAAMHQHSSHGQMQALAALGERLAVALDRADADTKESENPHSRAKSGLTAGVESGYPENRPGTVGAARGTAPEVGSDAA